MDLELLKRKHLETLKVISKHWHLAKDLLKGFVIRLHLERRKLKEIETPTHSEILKDWRKPRMMDLVRPRMISKDWLMVRAMEIVRVRDLEKPTLLDRLV